MVDVCASVKFRFFGDSEENEKAKKYLMDAIYDAEEDGNEIVVEESYEYVYADDYKELIESMNEEIKDIDLVALGEIDSDGNEFQSFRIECKKNKTIAYGSFWYEKMDLDDYEMDEILEAVKERGLSLDNEQRKKLEEVGYLIFEPIENSFEDERKIVFEPSMEVI